MATLSPQELQAKIKDLRERIEVAKRDKMQLEVRKESLEKELTELEPVILETFGTTDLEELTKIQNDLMAKISEI